MFNRLYAFVDLSVRYASVGSGVEAFPVLSESAACRRLDGSIGSRVRGDFGESVGEGRVEDTKDVDVDITMSENVKAYDQSPKMGEKYTKPKQSRVRAREDDSDEERQEVEAEIDGKNTRRHHKRRRLAPPARKQKKATTSQNNVSAFVVATPVTISAIPTTNNATTGGEQKKKKVQFDDELCRYSSFQSGDAPTDISVRASTNKTYSSCDDIGRAEIRREGQAKANYTVSDNKRRRIETPPSTSHNPPRSLLKGRTSKPKTVPLLVTTPTSSFRPVPDNFPPPVLIDASVSIIESYNGFPIPVVQVFEPEEWDVWSPMVRPRRRSNVLCAPLLDNRLRMVEAFEMVYRWGLHDPSIAGASTDWVKVKLRKAKKAAMLAMRKAEATALPMDIELAEKNASVKEPTATRRTRETRRTRSSTRAVIRITPRRTPSSEERGRPLTRAPIPATSVPSVVQPGLPSRFLPAFADAQQSMSASSHAKLEDQLPKPAVAAEDEQMKTMDKVENTTTFVKLQEKPETVTAKLQVPKVTEEEKAPVQDVFPLKKLRYRPRPVEPVRPMRSVPRRLWASMASSPTFNVFPDSMPNDYADHAPATCFTRQELWADVDRYRRVIFRRDCIYNTPTVVVEECEDVEQETRVAAVDAGAKPWTLAVHSPEHLFPPATGVEWRVLSNGEYTIVPKGELAVVPKITPLPKYTGMDILNAKQETLKERYELLGRTNGVILFTLNDVDDVKPQGMEREVLQTHKMVKPSARACGMSAMCEAARRRCSLIRETLTC